MHLHWHMCCKKGTRKVYLGGGPHRPCDIPSGCCFFTGPWTATRSSLRILRRVAAFCRPLRPVLLLVSFPRSRSPVVGVLGLCWMWQYVPLPPPPPPVKFSPAKERTWEGGEGVEMNWRCGRHLMEMGRWCGDRPGPKQRHANHRHNPETRHRPGEGERRP